MGKFIGLYVRYVDWVSDRFGRVAMYTVFLMIAVLLLGAITRNVLNMPLSWTVEMAQFTLAAYYTIGGAWSLKNNEHVRMDLIYDHCSDRNKARLDTLTSFFLIFYLVCLLIGAVSSTVYAIEYNQKKFSQWNPSMIPIKVIMLVGIVLMLLQAISTFFKDPAKARGRTIA